MRIIPLAAATLAVLGLAACGSTPPKSPAPAAAAPMQDHDAIANLASASGSLVSGRLQVMSMGANAVHIAGDVGGLAPGSSHGFHIHEKGD
jgi:Cu-Zn family superoxide dismutase